MKQLLIAGVLALGIHGFFLGLDVKWPGKISFERSKSQALRMTLISIPIKTAPRSDFQKPKPVLKKSKPIKKIKNPTHKRILKALPKKTVQIPVQAKKEDVSRTLPEKAADPVKPSLKSEPNVSETRLEPTEHIAAVHSPLETIHEAVPIYRSNPPPKYPRIARVRGYKGSVMLNVFVGRNGNVLDLKVTKSSGYPLLDRAATSSVKHWLFEPGRIGKEKTEMWVRVPIRFELKE
jgi:periplasmic protein TonB